MVGVAMLFCLETAAVRKRQEPQLEAVEIKYLILSILTGMDRIRNECTWWMFTS